MPYPGLNATCVFASPMVGKRSQAPYDTCSRIRGCTAMNPRIVIALLLLLAAAQPCLCATPAARAASPEELARACRAARPGDTIVLANGTYTNRHFVFTGKGTEERPIALRAQTPGKVVLNGASRLSIGGDHLVVDGLFFKEGGLQSGSIVEFRASGGGDARHCVLRNTAIVDYNPPRIDTRYFWVSLHGGDNTVERCWFSGQSHSGVTVCVWLKSGKPADHVIRRNYFGPRPAGNGNGFETIRIGTSGTAMTDARCLVEENVFERCDGEIEIISSKSCGNVYARNTFLDCAGCLTLRHGNRCRVEDNVFLGGRAGGAGGVRVIGEGHRVTGNYFSGTKGRSGGAIALHAGIPDSPPTGYVRVRDCLVDANTFVDNPGAIFALDAGHGSKGRTLLPEGVVVSNNLMVVPKGAKAVVAAKNTPTGITWKRNLSAGGTPGIRRPVGLFFVNCVPRSWATRLRPKPLKRTETGPGWMWDLPDYRPAEGGAAAKK